MTVLHAIDAVRGLALDALPYLACVALGFVIGVVLCGCWNPDPDR